MNRPIHLRYFFAVSISLVFNFQAASQSVSSRQASQPDAQPLILGQPIERKIKGGETHKYTVTAKAGDFLQVVVEQKGIDVVVSLFGPGGNKVTEVDSPNGADGPEPLGGIVEMTGVHTVTVTSLDKTAAPGHYEVRMLGTRASTIEDKVRTNAERAYEEATDLHRQRTAVSIVESLRKYEAALRLFRSINDRYGQAKTLNDMAGAYSDSGDQRTALKFLYESLPLARAIGNKKGEAETLNNIGGVHNYLGERRAAIEALTEALSIRQNIGDKRGQAMTLGNIGRVYDDIGEKAEALKFFTESLSLRREVGDKRGEATTLNNIGLVYYDLGERQQALKYYNESLPISRAIGDRYGESTTLSNIGGVHYSLGDNEQALIYYEQALKESRFIGDKSGEANLLNNIGVAYTLLGKKEVALRYFKESLPLLQETDDKQGEGRTLSNIAKIHNDLGDRQTALNYLYGSLVLLRSVGDKRGEALSLNNLFEIFQTSGERRLAVLYGKLAVNNYQALRTRVQGLDKNIQRTFLRSIEPTYRALAAALIDQQRYIEAQQVLELFKDQQFFDFSRPKEVSFVVMTARETRAFEGLNKRLDALTSVIQDIDDRKLRDGKAATTVGDAAISDRPEGSKQLAEKDYLAFVRQVQEDLSATPDESDKTRETAEIVRIRTVLKNVSGDTGNESVAVYTLVGENSFDALVITAESVDAVTFTIKATELNKKALALWELLRAPKYDPRLAARELYDIVFAPIEAKLPKGTKTVLWSLDGNLRYIPIAALYDGKKYLVERYQNVVFTRADKEQMTRPVADKLTGTGLGSSDAHAISLNGSNFTASALPEVKTELRRIFKNGDVNGTENSSAGILSGDVLLDKKFTKAAMLDAMKQRRPLVHIASHFKFEPGDEARSFLLLGDGDVMTLDEMKQTTDLFAGVELLTLSACETAAQKPDANGREVDGFAELAQRLGASAVMASLWEVSDSSTSELMSRFYSNYAGRSRMSKAAALRSAQLALLNGKYKSITDAERQLQREGKTAVASDTSTGKIFKPKRNAPFSHPFYWSPFILIGNWK